MSLLSPGTSGCPAHALANAPGGTRSHRLCLGRETSGRRRDKDRCTPSSPEEFGVLWVPPALLMVVRAEGKAVSGREGSGSLHVPAAPTSTQGTAVKGKTLSIQPEKCPGAELCLCGSGKGRAGAALAGLCPGALGTGSAHAWWVNHSQRGLGSAG